MRCPDLTALFCSALMWVCVDTALGTTLEDITQQPDLTPEKFAKIFAGFEFRFRSEVQSPQMFLASRSGDCDDYATLAAEVLRARGYNPQLVAVRMKSIVHVVCYVPEVKAYLDYNVRAERLPLVASTGSLAEIAEKVGKSFKKRWISASEFTFEQGRKRLVKTISESDSPHIPTQLVSKHASVQFGRPEYD